MRNREGKRVRSNKGFGLKFFYEPAVNHTVSGVSIWHGLVGVFSGLPSLGKKTKARHAFNNV
jgi:hypothetical protein